MGDNLLSPSRKQPSRVRSKVKTGCRTCKIRRVKCDEERPACRKCISTGRVCDGYGIWGGGGKNTPSSSSPTSIGPTRYYSPILSSGILSRDEALVFEWLLHRALKKLAGLFGSTFWETLVVQTSFIEPATLHALLALGSAHKSEILGQNRGGEAIMNEHDKLTLQQYNKSIRHLRAHYSNKNGNTSLLVALIACMIFASLEMVRRRYTAGNIHLVHGLKLLTEMQSHEGSIKGQTLIVKSHPDCTYDYITEVFMRLNSQSVLFGLGSPQIHLEFHDTKVQNLPLMFESVKQVRQYLDSLLDKIHHLAEHARHTALARANHPPELFHRQRLIKSGLAAWLQTYKASLLSLENGLSTKEIFALPLLRLFHIMATVMASTSLSPLDEMVFDSCTPDFVQTLTLIDEMLKNIASPAILKTICQGENSFTLGMGFNPPLYYMAMKCRHPCLRRLAVRCMLAMPHREGFWDGKMVACACREVMKLEERDFYADLQLNNNFDGCLDTIEREIRGAVANLDVAVLPESYRIHDARTILPHDSTGDVKLAYKRKTETGAFKSFETIIDLTELV